MDVVVAGQAFHWFDAGAALQEMRRILKPGGTLGLIWNTRDDRTPWVASLSRILGPERVKPTWRTSLEASSLFGPAEARTWHHEQMLDLEALLDLVSSRSYVLTLPRAARADLLRSVKRLWFEHPDLAGRANALLPYLTEAYRMQRT